MNEATIALPVGRRLEHDWRFEGFMIRQGTTTDGGDTWGVAQCAFDGAPIAIFRVDESGVIVAANDAACQALGYARSELVGMTVFDIDPAMRREAWPAHRRRVLAEGTRTLQTVHQRRDGTTFPVEVTVKYFEHDGLRFSLSFVRDISKRIEAEAARRLLEARMLHRQKLESLGVLAGGIAHDFRNLLAVVFGNLDVALQLLPDDAPARPLLAGVEQAAQQANDLCKQLLVYAGKESGRLDPLDLGALVMQQCQMLEVSVGKSAQLRYRLGHDLARVLGDASQLRQVFMNLVLNAAEAIREAEQNRHADRGLITITTAELDCDPEYLAESALLGELQPGRYVVVEVTDTGCGMSAEVMQKIFDPFFSTKEGGRGLGLAAVLGIVRNHGGGMKVYSEVGQGTTFKLYFPAAPRLAKSSSSAPPRPLPRASGVVLLVDDDPVVANVGRRILEKVGYDVLLASTGAQAVELYREHHAKVRCVLLDWTMPGMDGQETFRELRRVSPTVCVVFASGQSPEEIRRRVPGKGAFGFVRKPFNAEELSVTLHALPGADRLAGDAPAASSSAARGT